jgi:hypothetical protein
MTECSISRWQSKSGGSGILAFEQVSPLRALKPREELLVSEGRLVPFLSLAVRLALHRAYLNGVSPAP